MSAHVVDTLAVYVDDDAPRPPIAVRLEYHPARPLEVALHLFSRRDVLRWRVSRDVMRDGLTGAAGYCDVRMWPTAGTLRVRLDGDPVAPGGASVCTLALDRGVVERFLAQTARLVPYGTEVMPGLDAELTDLLRAEL